MRKKGTRKITEDLGLSTPTKTIYICDFGKNINIAEKIYYRYEEISSSSLGFDLEEESLEEIGQLFFRFYSTDNVSTLEEAMEGYVKQMLGDALLYGQAFGYSEYTIEGYDVSAATIGGHDLQKIIDAHKDKYLHILIDLIK